MEKKHIDATATPRSGYSRPRSVFVLDVLLSTLASLLAILVIRWLTKPLPGFSWMVLRWVGAGLLSTCIGLIVTRSWRDVREYATVRSVGKNTGTVLVKEALLAVALVFGLIGLPEVSLCWLIVLLDLILSSGFILGIRAVARSYSPSNKPQAVIEKASRRTALVWGTDSEAVQTARRLKSEGLEVLGLLDQDPTTAGRVIADYVVYHISGGDDLRSLQWKLGGVDAIYFPQRRPDSGDPVAIQPDEAPQTDGMSRAEHAVKRTFDIVLSALLLLVFSPVIGICALLVRHEDGGPAIFAQERIGRGGKPFRIYKFRTMRTDAEAAGTPALSSGEADPRLTRIGRFLRAHHLDELPQLWNVLRGDMSFIGPRPERRYYIGQILQLNPRYRYLFQIRPGVTSYATLYNGYTDSLEKMLIRLDLDLYYLRNHSLWFDAKVLMLTFLSIVTGKKF